MSAPVAVVTGGAGFIGSHMVDLLVGRGYEVRVIDSLLGGRESNLAHLKGNPQLKCEWKDIRALQPDDSIFKNSKYIFHFAGIGDIVRGPQGAATFGQGCIMATPDRGDTWETLPIQISATYALWAAPNQ